MAFPTSIPSNTDPTAANKLNNPSHSQLHQSHDAEIVAIETKLGTGASTPANNTFLIGNGAGTSAYSTITSVQLAARITDETGSGPAVFGTAPTISAPVVTTGTFASPALTTPAVTTSINDSGGNEVIRTPATALAVNDITVTNAATGNSPVISATGDDSNINLTLTPKGTGGIIMTKKYDGWVTGLATPNTVVANGNRSYSLTYTATDVTGTISPGMRLRTTRTVAAPTQCTSLNGSTQYYSKTSPAGMTFTVTTTTMGARKLNAYSAQWFGGRTTGTNGFRYGINASGQLIFEVQPGNATTKTVTSSQSVPLSKWFRFAFQIDLAGTCQIMLDGIAIPSTTAGSATALTQAVADFQLGAAGGTGFTNGKMAQDAIFSAKLADATVRSYESQSYLGTETSLISAYSFNNSINDLNANANNLTANGSAVATNADSPFGGQAGGSISSTLDYGIIQSATFSTDTTIVVQVPEGCTIPTSGGVSAVSYSSNKAPYGMPVQRDKWVIQSQIRIQLTTTSNATYGSFSSGGWLVTAPLGSWNAGWRAGVGFSQSTTTVRFLLASTDPTGLAGSAPQDLSLAQSIVSPSAALMVAPFYCASQQTLSSQTTFKMYTLGAVTSSGIDGTTGLAEIFLENTLL